MRTCPICNRPANARYSRFYAAYENEPLAAEQCFHRCHDPHLTSVQRSFARLKRALNQTNA